MKKRGIIDWQIKYLYEFIIINHTICICGDCRCCSLLIYTMHNYSLFMSFHMSAQAFKFSITDPAFWTIESMSFKGGLISEGILNSARPLIKGKFFQKIISSRYHVVVRSQFLQTFYSTQGLIMFAKLEDLTSNIISSEKNLPLTK